MTEEDGDEIFIPIEDVRCCGLRLWPSHGFWKCPSCLRSFGPIETNNIAPVFEVIGNLMDAKVLIDRSASTVIIAHPDMPPIKFSIDHPYIQGTKLERDARAAIARSPQEGETQ